MKMPLLSKTNNEVEMYFGRKGVAGDPSTDQTWSSDFRGVWHLEGLAFDDATSSANNFSGLGNWGENNLVPALTGSGVRLDGSTNYLEISSADPFNFEQGSFTISGWIKNNSTSSSTPGAPAIGMVDVMINAGSDDAEETYPDGVFNVGSSDLEIGTEYGGANLVGLRFNSIQIPRGAKIIDAYLEFTMDDDISSSHTRTFIYAEDNPSPVTFSTNSNGLVSDRVRTSFTVDWIIDPWTSPGDKDRSPEVTELVQHLVNNNDWNSGNSMVFILDGYGKRYAQSFEKSGGVPAKLHVEFESVDATLTQFFPVAAAEDDVNELPDGTISFGSTTTRERLEFGTFPACGIRFSSVDIPQGATIENAYIEFYAGAGNSTGSNFEIYAENTHHSASFSGEPAELTKKSTIGPVIWSNVENWTSGTWYTSPSVTTLIQEIINKADWQNGNALTLLIKGSGRRQARSGDWGAAYAPRLVIEYSILVSDPQPVLTRYDGAAGYKIWVGSNGRLYFGIDDDDAWDPDVMVSSRSFVNDNAWHHFAVSKQENDSISVFIDGKFENSRGVGTKTYFQRINASENDAEESASGSVTITSSILNISKNGSADNLVGLRFTDVSVPEGARIVKANIGMMVESISATGENSTKIVGEGVPDAAPFSGSSSELTNRLSAATSLQVDWAMADFSRVADIVFTPDIGPLINEIINQTDGWAAGNAMAFYFQGGDFGRYVESYDSRPARAAFLIIEYEESPFGTLSSTASLQVGADTENEALLSGQLNELQIIDAARDESWLFAHYNNLAAPSSFMSVGHREGIVSSGGDWSDPGSWNLGAVPWSDADIYIADALVPLALDQDIAVGSLYISDGGELDLNGHRLVAKCNITNDGAINSTSGVLEFAGNTTTELTGAGTTAVFELKVNTGGETVVLSQDILVTNSIEFLSSGRIELYRSTLELNNGTISGLTDDFAELIILGNNGQVNVRALQPEARVDIPIAYSHEQADYARINLTNKGGAAEDFSITLCNKVYTDGTCDGAGEGTLVTANGVGWTWDVNTASTNAIVTLYWHEDSHLSGFNASYCAINHFDSGEGIWEVVSDPVAANSHGSGIYSLSAQIYSFSPLGVSEGDGPLPVEFLYLKGEKLQDGSHVLEWATASETNNEKFVVEKSDNGKEFFAIGSLEGAGNSLNTLKYTYKDYSGGCPAGCYYRIKQIDFDHKYAYSQVIYLGRSSHYQPHTRLFPNPVSAGEPFDLKVELDGVTDEMLRVSLFDMTGREIFNKSLPVDTTVIGISGNAALQPGIYLLTIDGQNFQSSHRVAVR